MVDQSLNRPPRPASNPVDEVLLVHEAGGDLVQTASGKWAAKDRDGAIVVRGALSMGEAARLYCEDRGLPTAKPAMPDDILAGICRDYEPFGSMPEFRIGFDAYRSGCFHENPYEPDSVAAQAWDGGLLAAQRYQCALDAADRGAVVEAARPPGKPGGRR